MTLITGMSIMLTVIHSGTDYMGVNYACCQTVTLITWMSNTVALITGVSITLTVKHSGTDYRGVNYACCQIVTFFFFSFRLIPKKLMSSYTGM